MQFKFQNSSISNNSVLHMYSLVLFNPLIGSYQVVSLWVRVDLGAMAMNGYSALPKAPALLESHHLIV